MIRSLACSSFSWRRLNMKQQDSIGIGGLQKSRQITALSSQSTRFLQQFLESVCNANFLSPFAIGHHQFATAIATIATIATMVLDKPTRSLPPGSSFASRSQPIRHRQTYRLAGKRVTHPFWSIFLGSETMQTETTGIGKVYTSKSEFAGVAPLCQESSWIVHVDSRSPISHILTIPEWPSCFSLGTFGWWSPTFEIFPEPTNPFGLNDEPQLASVYMHIYIQYIHIYIYNNIKYGYV